MTIVETILTAANVPHREARFIKPPAGTYAVWFDDIVQTDGPDYINSIKQHSYTIELYASPADPTAETAIENAIDEAGLRWSKQRRYWIQTEQMYQTIYEFDYIEKRRIT